jgi:hypothetical protein
MWEDEITVTRREWAGGRGRDMVRDAITSIVRAQPSLSFAEHDTSHYAAKHVASSESTTIVVALENDRDEDVFVTISDAAQSREELTNRVIAQLIADGFGVRHDPAARKWF